MIVLLTEICELSDAPSLCQWIQKLKVYMEADELPASLFDNECVHSITKVDLKGFCMVKLPEGKLRCGLHVMVVFPLTARHSAEA